MDHFGSNAISWPAASSLIVVSAVLACRNSQPVHGAGSLEALQKLDCGGGKISYPASVAFFRYMKKARAALKHAIKPMVGRGLGIPRPCQYPRPLREAPAVFNVLRALQLGIWKLVEIFNDGGIQTTLDGDVGCTFSRRVMPQHCRSPQNAWQLVDIGDQLIDLPNQATGVRLAFCYS